MEADPKKSAIFLLIILLVLAVIGGLIAYQDLVMQNIVWIIIALAVLLLAWRFNYLLLLKEYERAVISTFGKVNRVGGPGWAILFPPVENAEIVDLRTHTIDIKPQHVVTKDKIELEIDAMIFLKVKGDKQSVIHSKINVENYEKSAGLFVEASIRDVAGSMTADEVISSIALLNAKVKTNLEQISQDWGVKVESVEIKSVELPREILDSMHREKAAEQQRLARLQLARAHGAEIDAVKEAAENLSDRALAYYYIKALEKMSEGRSTKLVFPMEISRLAEAVSGRFGISGNAGVIAPPRVRGKRAGSAAKVAEFAGGGNLDEMFRRYKPAIDAYLRGRGLRLSAISKGTSVKGKNKPKK